MRPPSAVLAILAALVLVGVGCAREASWEAAVDAWAWPAPLPDLPLVDQDGQAFSLGRHAEDWVLLGFVFTRCSVVEACPLTMTRMAAVQRRWQEVTAEGRTEGTDLHLLALTLDPAWDTPERLHAYGARHGIDPASFTLATGPEPLLGEALPSMLSVLVLPDEEEILRHSVKLFLLRPGLEVAADWSDAEASAEGIVGRILSEHGADPR